MADRLHSGLREAIPFRRLLSVYAEVTEYESTPESGVYNSGASDGRYGDVGRYRGSHHAPHPAR